MRELNPNAIISSFSMKERGQLKNMIKTTSLPEGFTFADFVEWSLQNWLLVKSTNTHLAGLPDVLTVPIFVGYRNSILKLWNNRTETKELKVATKFDRIVRFYIKRGHSYEEARQLAMQETEVGKKEKLLTQKEQMLKLKEERLAKQEADAFRKRAEQRLSAKVSPVKKANIVKDDSYDKYFEEERAKHDAEVQKIKEKGKGIDHDAVYDEELKFTLPTPKKSTQNNEQKNLDDSLEFHGKGKTFDLGKWEDYE